MVEGKDKSDGFKWLEEEMACMRLEGWEEP